MLRHEVNGAARRFCASRISTDRGTPRLRPEVGDGGFDRFKDKVSPGRPCCRLWARFGPSAPTMSRPELGTGLLRRAGFHSISVLPRIRTKFSAIEPCGLRRRTGAQMTDLEALDRSILELKDWLSGAWRHLARPSLTKFERQELRNEMKQCNVELRRCLDLVRTERADRRGQSLAGPDSGVIHVNFKLIGQNPPK